MIPHSTSPGVPALDPAVVPFVDAVARQLAFGAESPPEDEERARVVSLLRLAAGGGSRAAAEALARDGRLASALFANIDLLYDGGWPGADAVSLAVMEAVEIADGGGGE